MSHQIIVCALLLSASLTNSRMVTVSDDNSYAQEVLNNKKSILVKFSADWCSVCNSVQKPFEEISREPEFEDITFVQVDVDKLDSVSKQNGIVGVPTFVYMENGAKKVEEIGVHNMPAFKDHLRDNLRKNFKVAQGNQGLESKPTEQIEKVKVTKGKVEAPVAQENEPGMIMRILNGIKDFLHVGYYSSKKYYCKKSNA